MRKQGLSPLQLGWGSQKQALLSPSAVRTCWSSTELCKGPFLAAAPRLVLSCLHSSISWLVAIRSGAICLVLLIHTRKHAFEVVWKARKETCFTLLALLPERNKILLFISCSYCAVQVSAPMAHGPVHPEASLVQLQRGRTERPSLFLYSRLMGARMLV